MDTKLGRIAWSSRKRYFGRSGATDVDFGRILGGARDEKGCAIFETFSTDGPSAFLVVNRSRWDKDQKRLNAP